MIGPYSTGKGRSIKYKGNKIFGPIEDVRKYDFPTKEMQERVSQLSQNPMWTHITRINHRINISANEYFDQIGALFIPLPLTTRMISSPGAVYGKEAIDYTSDTCPITLKWFDMKEKAFLSESSQIYLELALIQQGIDQGYSIYNSFRKEHADATHLSEFHHIEYEGKANQKENVKVALGLVGKIIGDLIAHNEQDIAYFLESDKLKKLSELEKNIQNIPKITFREALDALYTETRQEKYKRFTMKESFGSWEEVKLTEIFGNMIEINQYPLLEVPFYHCPVEGIEHAWTEKQLKKIIGVAAFAKAASGVAIPSSLEIEVTKKSKVADNSDFIWPGYREFIGSGHRVESVEQLESKAKIFNLPREDYAPYLQTRKLPNYSPTSGFGLGWERLLHGLLELPFIWNTAQFPRGHTALKP